MSREIKKEKEIFSPCCCFGTDGTEEVHALIEDCPIKRAEGKRQSTHREFVDGEIVEKEVTECTCIYRSGLSGIIIPRCEHYKGTKKVRRNKKSVYKIICAALEGDTNE